MAYYQTSTPKQSGPVKSDDTSSLCRQLSQRSWVEKTFLKRSCVKFIKSPRDHTKCCCGRSEAWHQKLPKSDADGACGDGGGGSGERWHPLKHTEVKPTDAYGTIEFQGAPHPSKAQYVRLSSFDTRPEQVLHLLQKHWGLDLPKLLITVHGGILNFDLQPKLKRVFRKGLLKAAKTTGAWIITGGTNTGVTRHVGDAISDRTTKTKNKVVAIGIAPWGIVENREDLIGRDVVVPYHCISSPKTASAVLNSNHSFFLLCDNGTMGKYGGEIVFRKKLEKFIAQQKICITSGFMGRGVPVICVVLEGGANTIRSVLEYVTDTPPVPVVVCDGSGRAADLLAFTHKYTMDDGTMPESLRDQLILTIEKTFQYAPEQAEKLFIELMLCVKKKELITVFRMSEGSQDIDLAILTALLKGTNASAPDQLSLVLTWDRVDIARSHIFVYGQEWPEGSLEQAMMDALINDRVDFVKLLLENGVSMHTFLTIARLEELYNTRRGPTNTLRYLVRDVRKHVPSRYNFTLPDIGMVVQHLMGGAFRSSYCRKRFRQKYHAIKNQQPEHEGASVGNIVTAIPHLVNVRQAEELFPYPFHDLMIWSVLMKRQKMALFMWQHGEEAMAKALMACKLYKAMAHEADQDDLEIELSDEFRSYAREFQVLALELLEHCYKIDDDYTQQLLTYELKNFSKQTCLCLAVTANHREFIAHICCQILLNDLWIGGLRMRKNTSLKVIMGILMPLYILALEFKSKEELQLMPQTMEEHLEELEDDASEDNVSLGGLNEDQNDFGDLETSFNSTMQSAPKENGNLLTDVSHYTNLPFKKKKSPLRLGKKVYEFYNAPVTKFWAHTMAYLSFLICFAYCVLAEFKSKPEWPEYYVMIYILSLASEKVRQILASEPNKMSLKLQVYISELWNIWDTLAITLFATGVALRLYTPTEEAGRITYTVDIVFWFIRILEILSVNKYLGPYVKIIGKLIVDMAYFIIILFIVVTSFGIVRQSIQNNGKHLEWSLVLRNVWFYPYWMIYGELFAEEIDPCEDPNKDCVYGSWVAPALMCLYLLVANILMVNLLIARFNATFIRNNANSMEIWKFQRYQLIQEYEMRPILPPPLIMVSHVYLILRYIKRRCQGKRDLFDNGLKLFLSHEDTEKLHDFEEECVEDYFREKENKFQSSSEERIRIINERVENMSMRVDDINQKENTIKMSLQTVDFRLGRLEEIAQQTQESVYLIQTFLSHHDSSSRFSTFQDSHQSYDSVITEGSGLQQGEDRSESRSVENLPDSTLLINNSPSPVLVHSKRPVEQEQIEKFTNYSRGRHLSGCSFSSEPLSSAEQTSSKDKNVVVVAGSNTSVHVPVLGLGGRIASVEKKIPLLQRRHGPLLSSIKIRRGRQAERLKTPSFVRFADTILPSAAELIAGAETDAIFTVVKLPSDTLTCTQKPASLDLAPQQQQQSLGTVRNEIAATPISPEVLPLSPPHPLPAVTTFSSSSISDSIPQSAVKDLSAILVPFHAEYTTITDEIDTSCMVDRSPVRSPVSSNIFFSESFHDPRTGTETPACRSEKELLRQAEEMEHRKMEKVIRHRLRQISLDDSDNLSDIAMVAAEMASSDDKNSHDDDEDLEEDETPSFPAITISTSSPDQQSQC